jgi:broad specificity phosphatase PhoE
MLKNLLQPYSKDDKISLLIRHSDRYDISDGGEGHNVLLNDVGKTNAINFGKNLSAYKLNKIITTSVERCIQTAEYIVKGYGHSVEIEPSNTFGGLHISDWQAANTFLSEEGYPEWYRRIVNDISSPGIQTSIQYNKLMTNFLTENTIEKGLTIFVSHDFLIAYYHYTLDKTIYSWDSWVKYLSGLILQNGKYVAGFQNN